MTYFSISLATMPQCTSSRYLSNTVVHFDDIFCFHNISALFDHENNIFCYFLCRLDIIIRVHIVLYLEWFGHTTQIKYYIGRLMSWVLVGFCRGFGRRMSRVFGWLLSGAFGWFMSGGFGWLLSGGLWLAYVRGLAGFVYHSATGMECHDPMEMGAWSNNDENGILFQTET